MWLENADVGENTESTESTSNSTEHGRSKKTGNSKASAKAKVSEKWPEVFAISDEDSDNDVLTVTPPKAKAKATTMTSSTSSESNSNAFTAYNYDDVIEELDAILCVDPTNTEALHTRALLLLLMGHTEACLFDLQTCLAVEPRHFPSLLTQAGENFLLFVL